MTRLGAFLPSGQLLGPSRVILTVTLSLHSSDTKCRHFGPFLTSLATFSGHTGLVSPWTESNPSRWYDPNHWAVHCGQKEPHNVPEERGGFLEEFFAELKWAGNKINTRIAYSVTWCFRRKKIAQFLLTWPKTGKNGQLQHSHYLVRLDPKITVQ